MNPRALFLHLFIGGWVGVTAVLFGMTGFLIAFAAWTAIFLFIELVL